jgi:hypothetical protein
MKVTQLIVGSVTPVAIIIQSRGPISKLTLGENRSVGGWPTTSWRFCDVNWNDASASSMLAGTLKEFGIGGAAIHNTGTYSPDQTIAYLLTDAGTTTFDQIEEP